MKRRVVYFDVLNVLACICVIALHCNGIVHTFSNTMAWKQSLFVEVVAYWAVPVFFMLTGATTINYRDRYNTETFFRKRVSGALIPFLGASGFYLVYRSIRKEYTIGSITGVISSIFNCELQSRYWFFIPLFAIYLGIPVISLLKNNRKVLWYMVGCSFLTQFFLPVILPLVGITYNGALSFPITGGACITYAILGYLLHTEELNKKKRLGIYALALVSAIVRYGVTYILSIRDGSTNTILFSYTNFVAFFLAIGVFTFFKYCGVNKLKNDTILKILKWLSGCSLGVYLVHSLAMDFQLEILGIERENILWRTLGIISTYLMSLIIVAIIKKIPFLNRIMP